MLEGSSADEYPYLRAAVDRLVKARTDPEQRFENGLDLILDALVQRFGAEVGRTDRAKVMTR